MHADSWKMLAGAALFAAALSAAAPAYAQKLVLVADGKPRAVVVLPDSAGKDEQHAAHLIVTHVERMTGARLEVKRESALKGAKVVDGRVVLARAPDNPVSGRERPPGEETPGQPVPTSFILVGQNNLAKELGVDTKGVGVGGIRLKTVGNALVILGGPASAPGEMGTDSGGLRYAVVEILERVGCAYLWPGPVGKVVPRTETVAVDPLDVAYTPQIRRRYIRFSHWHARSDAGLRHLGLTREQLEEWRKARQDLEDKSERADLKAIGWAAWTRLGGRLPSFGHAGCGLRNGEKRTATHPEWFALQADGTRDQGGDRRWRLCLSNPRLIAYVADDIVRRANENPSLSLVSLDPNDGGSNTGWCLCDRCKALDAPEGAPIRLMTFGDRVRPDRPTRRREIIEYVSLTDRMVYYWNSVAERVTRVHPDMKFGVSVYSAWQHPPLKRKLHPSLVARYVPGSTEHLAGWQEAGLKNVFWRPNILLFNRRDGKLRSIVGPLAEAMRGFAEAGIRQTDFDSIMHNWATGGLSYYAAARLNWDPRLRAEDIVRTYARAGFGPAAEPIEKYFLRVELLTREGVKRSFIAPEDFRYTPEVTAELRALLNSAATAAGDDAEIVARIDFLRLGLNYTELQETLDDLARRAKAKDPAYDPAKARRLMDLHYLTLVDLMVNHTSAVNVPRIAWGSGGFAKWRVLPPPASRLSDESLLARIEDPRYGLTGREDSLADMFRAFGMEPPQ